ncbi:MAG: aspartate aminotransferase family protein [Chloroflexi bacterium]|nr:aspartate aminotransferase family protein [Chloroflexota bacterium]
MTSPSTAPSNRDYRDRAARVFPGGTIGTYLIPDEVDFVVAGGKGSHISDVEGREYIDYVIGSGPLILGHAHPAVVEAIQRQAALGTQFYVSTPAAVELAEVMVGAIPCAEQVKFSSTGAEATFYALRLARAYTGRNKILKFEGAYHGHHDYAYLSVISKQAGNYPTPQPDTAGIPPSVLGEVLVAPYNDLATTARIVEEHRNELAAVIVEPFQRTIPPVPGFLEGLRAVTRQNGVLLVFDEVVTGFRLAWGGAQQHYGVVPDLAAYGKIIGGGLPLSAVAGPRDILELANPRRAGRPGYVYFSGTLNGNPLAAAAGLAALHVLQQPGSYERLHEVGDRLRDGLAALVEQMEVDAQVVGVGPLVNVYFTSEPIVSYQSTQSSSAALRRAVTIELLRQGVHANLAAKLYLSLALSDADIDATLAAFEQAFTTVLVGARRNA